MQDEKRIQPPAHPLVRLGPILERLKSYDNDIALSPKRSEADKAARQLFVAACVEMQKHLKSMERAAVKGDYEPLSEGRLDYDSYPSCEGTA